MEEDQLVQLPSPQNKAGTPIRKVLNPFESDPTRNCYNYFKWVIVGFTLFPIRVAVFILSLLLATPFCFLASCCADEDLETQRPPSCCSRLLLIPVRVAARCILWSFGYWWISVDTPRNPQHASIIVANHVSLLDAVYFMYAYCPSFLAKAAVRKIPLIGRTGAALQVLWVDRLNPESRRQVVAAIKVLRRFAFFSHSPSVHAHSSRCSHNYPQRRASSGKFPPLLIFPEGTTTNGHCLIRFKNGPFSPGVPVKPVCLRYNHRHVNPAATGRAGDGGGSMLELMLQFYNTLHVSELPAHVPTELEQQQPSVFAAHVRSAMAERLQVPVTEHSYADFFLRKAADGARVNQTFEMEALSRLFDVKLEEVTILLRKFQEADVDNSGSISLEEFCAALGMDLPPSEHARMLFSFFDADDTGDVDFTEFVYGIALLSPQCSREDRRRLVFSIYDRDADGFVTWAEIERVITFLARHRQAQSSVVDTVASAAASDGTVATVADEESGKSADGDGDGDDDMEDVPLDTPALQRRPSAAVRAEQLHAMLGNVRTTFDALAAAAATGDAAGAEADETKGAEATADAGSAGQLNYEQFCALLDQQAGNAALLERVPLDWATSKAEVTLEEVRVDATELREQKQAEKEARAARRAQQ